MRLVWSALMTCVLLSGCQPAPLPSAAPEGNWISLFNGRNLDGWTPKFVGHPLGENVLDTFRVEDGVLKVSYEKYDEFHGWIGHLFYQQPFSHYWLRVDYRFVGKQVRGAPDWAFRNNGVMMHCQPPETMELNQDFPVSVELRLLGGTFRRRPTGNLCTPGTSVLFKGERSKIHCLDSSSHTFRGDQWVRAEAEVRGGEVIRHFINGSLVMEYTDLRLDQPQPWSPTLELTSGYIAIQAESHPTEFRRIEVLNLDK